MMASTATLAAPRPPAAAAKEPTGIWSWITTVDHKRIGILYGVTALAFFFIGGLEALLLRIQLGTPENTFLDAETYNQLFTMHGTTMIFLAIMPLGAAFFNFLVPLMIGARDVAFPRLNAFSYWVFLLGGLFLNSSFLFGAAPDVGWFGYANLTSRAFSPGLNVDFWLLGLQVLGIASLAAGFNFIVTIVNLRAPGMSLMRMPVFVWMTLVVSFLIILAFPVVTVALFLLMFDRFFGTNFYIPAAGGDPLLWQHLFWIFGHPEVYILILPAMGMVSDVLPTFSRKPLFGYAVVVYSGIMIGVLGFGVWAHHMFSTGLGPIADSVFSISTMLIAIPTGVKIFNWIATLWGGALRLTTSLWFAIGFIGMFTIGGISGIMHASPPADLQQTDTYFVVAHFHYVLFGGSLLGIFAGIYYWFPKVTGRMLSETLGKWHFWLILLGFNMTFLPMHWLGLHGMTRRVFTYSADMNFGFWNLFATVGTFVISVSLLIFVWNVLASLRGGAVAGDNPWDAPTLEWTTTSPPAEYNFAVTPHVTSRYPLWDREHPELVSDRPDDEVKVVLGGRTMGRTHVPDDPESAEVHGGERGPTPHMPNPSFWPAVAALGLTIVPVGLMLYGTKGLGPGLGVGLVGVALLFFAVYRWAFEPLEG
ncbi:MAG: cytochrome c oxidase subunit I [Gemmatimonadota bacterium]